MTTIAAFDQYIEKFRAPEGIRYRRVTLAGVLTGPVLGFVNDPTGEPCALVYHEEDGRAWSVPIDCCKFNIIEGRP